MIKSSNKELRPDPRSNESTIFAEIRNGYVTSSATPVVEAPFRLPWYFRLKYLFEQLIALILLVPALPVVALLACLVRITSRGPVIYRQTRVGLNGKEFSMLKIRTMFVDAESKSGPTWCKQSDPRVTGVGKWLRFLHLDELPQLINVIKGEMAIIGPRPERPVFVKLFAKSIDNYTDRLAIKPGITGLAQIYLPPDETIDCVRKKIRLDRAYIESADPSVDIRIWLCTFVRIIGLREGRGPKWFGLNQRYQDLVANGELDSNGDLDSLGSHDEVSEPITETGYGQANSSEENMNGHFRIDAADETADRHSRHSVLPTRNRKAK